MITTLENINDLTIQPENFYEARGMVNGINIFYKAKGICPSQKAKYELPNWALVALFLPGNDRGIKALTASDISKLLKKKNINKTPYSITNILNHMIHLGKAIHPHRRNIGSSCYNLVKEMGGVKVITLTPEEAGQPVSVNAYHFGKSHTEVKAIRRKHNLRIRD